MTQPTGKQTTRRDFMKASSAAALGAGLLGNLSPISARAFAGGDETIKIGLVGCGGRGTGAAGQAMNTAGPTALVAMGDVFPDHLQRSLKTLARQHSDKVQVPEDRQFIGFDAYQKVLETDVDLVILATPPGFRPIHFEAAVNAGKNVFMEKPVAVDAPGVRRVLEANKKAKQKGLAVAVGLQRRHEDRYKQTVKRVHDGAIGDIIALRVYWNGGGVWEPRKRRDQVRSEMEYQLRNWYYYTWLCGDHIVEQHIHNIDVGNWVKGQYPVMAYGMGGRQVRTDPKYGQIFDHHAVEYVFKDGSRMFSQCRHIRNCWNSVSEHAHGSKGYADIGGALIEADGKKWRYGSGGAGGHQQEHHDLFADLRAGRIPNEGEYGALSTMTAIMGRMATYSGKPVSWDDALHSELNLLPERFAWDADPPVLPNEKGEYPVAVPGVTRAL